MFVLVDMIGGTVKPGDKVHDVKGGKWIMESYKMIAPDLCEVHVKPQEGNDEPPRKFYPSMLYLMVKEVAA